MSPILHDAMTTGNAFARVDYADRHEHLELIALYSQTRYQIPIDPRFCRFPRPRGARGRGSDVLGNLPTPFVPYDANPLEDERDLFAAVSYISRDAESRLQVTPFVRESYSRLSCDPAGSLGPDGGPTHLQRRRARRHPPGRPRRFELDRREEPRLESRPVADIAFSHVDYTSYTRDNASPNGGPDRSLTLSGHDDTTVLLAGAYLQAGSPPGQVDHLPGDTSRRRDATFGSGGDASLLLVGPSARLGVSYSLTTSLDAHAYAGYIWQLPNTIDGPVAARILGLSLRRKTSPTDLKAEKDWTGELGS